MYRWGCILKAHLTGVFMSTTFIDRTGMRFGRLVAISRAGVSSSKKTMWECRCDCGVSKQVDACSLVTGHIISCGCALKEAITKHGGSHKGSYNTWRAMIRRCTKPADKDFPRYGGRGTTVCAEWLDYQTFAADMGEPTGTETLDRIDPYGNYEPSNCQWATPTAQNRNTRLRATSKTGYIGVSKTGPNSWMAKITVCKKAFYSKCFRTVEEAAIARKELERLHWGVS